MDLKQEIAQDIYKALEKKIPFESVYDLIEVPRINTHGDYAFPVFSLAKTYKKNPTIIAKELSKKIPMHHYDNVVSVGPYINFFLNKEEISSKVLDTIVEEKNHYGDSNEGVGKNIPIDLSSPNIAKPMSMGHLRSTVIGNSIGNILDKLGYNPIRINHIGDWGTQFGKLIVAYRKWGDPDIVHQDPINELLKLYVHFHNEMEEHPELEDEAREWFKRLEDDDKEAISLWKWFRKVSLLEFKRIYKKLNVDFDYYTGEAFYNDKMYKGFELLKEKDLLVLDDDAEIVKLDKYNLSPALIRKSDGATLYITRDIAAALYRKEEFDFYEALYVVGNEQSNHFKQLKAILKELDLDWADDIHHIPFGLISFKGAKLSTRKGNVVLLEEVLDKATKVVREQIQEKNPDLENKDKVAHDIGVGAVIFNDLKNDRLNSINFNLNEIIRYEGETGPYVQYTRSRCESILSKVNWQPDQKVNEYNLYDAESWEIIKNLNSFPTKIQEARQKYEPSIITNYLIDLAQNFNKYYSKHQILADDINQESRLALVYSTSVVIKEGLRLLGIKSPDRI